MLRGGHLIHAIIDEISLSIFKRVIERYEPYSTAHRVGMNGLAPQLDQQKVVSVGINHILPCEWRLALTHGGTYERAAGVVTGRDRVLLQNANAHFVKHVLCRETSCQVRSPRQARILRL